MSLMNILPIIADVGAKSPLVQFDPTMVMQIINTIILFLLLKHFLFKPVSEFMKNREKEISDEYERAENLQKEAENLRAQYDLQMQELEEKGREIIKEASHKADERAAEIIKEAESEIVRMKEKAKSDIKQQQIKAMNSLKDEIASMAIITASQVMERDIGADCHREFISRIIDEMGDARWQN